MSSVLIMVTNDTTTIELTAEQLDLLQILVDDHISADDDEEVFDGSIACAEGLLKILSGK